jgi:hypothetical protein
MSDAAYRRAATEQMAAELPRKLPRIGKMDQTPAETQSAADSQPAASQKLTGTASDGIRPRHVDLGNPPEVNPNGLLNEH